MEGHGGAKRRSAEGVGSEEGRRSPSLVWGSGGISPIKFLKFNSANLFIFKLHGLKYIKMSTHSSKVNCTLDKVNCTLCVRKHTILGPAIQRGVWL